MKDKRKRTIPLGRAVLLCVLCLLAGMAVVLGLLGGMLGRDGVTLLQANYLIEKTFVGEYDREAYMDTVLNTMVEALGDRWSYYLDAESVQQTQETRSNAYVGIGITISQEAMDGLEILSVTPGGAAQTAGIQPGEIIRSVDGTVITKENRDEMVDAIRGQEGTSVVLTVEGADGVRRTVEIVRGTIQGVSAQWSMLEGQVGYLTIANFYSGTAQQVSQGLTELVKQGAQALVLDVRFNPGGYVTEMTEILDQLLPEGDIFRSEDYRGREYVYQSDEMGTFLPMAVLINGDSYSAAEFLAAQLQESAGAVLVGAQTSGKGFSQRLLPLVGGGGLNLSTARYFTGAGRSLIGTGLTPDLPVEMDEETQIKCYRGQLPPEEDLQLQAALEALAGE